jgi:hypothetical protein
MSSRGTGQSGSPPGFPYLRLFIVYCRGSHFVINDEASPRQHSITPTLNHSSPPPVSNRCDRHGDHIHKGGNASDRVSEGG